MATRRWRAPILLVATALVVGIAAGARADDATGLPPVPDTPLAPSDLLAVRPFTVDVPFELRGTADRTAVDRGWLLVLAVDPRVAIPRQLASPVLYVGNRVAVYGARPDRPGRIVALVPGDVDLATAPVWFGAPELPERVDRATIVRERARAAAAGIRPVSGDALRRARERGGPAARVADEAGLEAVAAALLASIP